MEVLDKGFGALSQALLGSGFREVDEFDAFVTLARDGDPLKIQVGPDGSFAVFDIDDKCITEGEGAEDLYRVLVAKPAPVLEPREKKQRRRSRPKTLLPFLDSLEAIVRR